VESTPHYHLHCRLHCLAAARVPQQGRPEPLGSKAPQSLSQRVPPPDVRAGVSWAETLVTVMGACPKVPTDQ
jgi:hypothetical protein